MHHECPVMMPELDCTVLVVSFHDWKSKRLAGFHKIGEALLESGYDVYFASHYRPVAVALFNKDEINCFRNWRALMKGLVTTIGIARLVNFTALNLALPGPLRRGPLTRVNEWVLDWSNQLLAKKCRRLCSSPKCIVIESGGSITAYPALKKVYPDVRFIYRPSDPSIGSLNAPEALLETERRLVREADAVCLVNEEGRRLYQENGYELDASKTYLLPNGIDMAAFRAKYEVPEDLAVAESVCYVGGHPPDWRPIFALADKRPDLRIVIVCPEALSPAIAKDVAARSELIYIEGLSPEQVPAYVTNTTVIIIPYPDGWGARPLGMHGKVMQAMYAKKPIVATNLDPSLRSEGIYIESTPESFAERVISFLAGSVPEYKFDFSDKDWSTFKRRFIEYTGL